MSVGEGVVTMVEQDDEMYKICIVVSCLQFKHASIRLWLKSGTQRC